MRTIHKYTLLIGGEQKIILTKGALILAAQAQNEVVTLWALLDVEAEKERRTFEVFGTGWTIEDKPLAYIDTVQLQGGAFIFHVFEVLHAPV